jgi:hypothetical protein
MQDIRGLRAILETPEQARTLAASLINVTQKFQLVGSPDDYIAHPKRSGYRSIHQVYRYVADADEDPKLNGMTFEVQFRSRLQHAWATTNEVVGTFRREELKSGIGDPDWLRFFSLAGAVIARSEGGTIGKYVPQDLASLDADFRSLRDKLNVFERISSYNVTHDVTQNGRAPADARFFVLMFDLAHRHISYAAFGPLEFAAAASRYLEAENAHMSDSNYDNVLVSVDSLAQLRDAYPNYYADTGAFLHTVYSEDEFDEIMRRSAEVDERLGRQP